jgi:beta-glucanase (GH16 family)
MRRLQAAVRGWMLLLLPGAAMADWQLAHHLDFASARALDPQFWSLETGLLRNQERQYYTPANVSVGQGFLRIEARREQVANAAHRPGARGWRNAQPFAQYTSGSITSKPAFLYGRFEIVARSPGGNGVWPAIWLLHESAQQYGEIDIHESVGKHPDTAFAGVHYGRTPSTREHRNANRQVPGFEGSWHTHAVEWTPERITLLLDGVPLMTFDPRDAAKGGVDPLRRPMRLRINLALGGTWGGPIDDSRLPARFDIASIRIWHWQPGATQAVTAPALPASAPAATEAPVADAPLPVPRWGR